MQHRRSEHRGWRRGWLLWPLALALVLLAVAAACGDDEDGEEAPAAATTAPAAKPAAATTTPAATPAAATTTPAATPAAATPDPTATATPTATAPAAQPVYLALGDSLATGVGASDPATTAYVPQIHEALGGADAYELVNLGVSGERTATMIADGQLGAAVAELEARNGNADPADDVRIVTIDIGGNDVFAIAEVCRQGVTAECLASAGVAAQGFADNFGMIVGQIRAAAGPETRIVVMSYYNSLVDPGCSLNAFAEFATVVLEGEPALGVEAGLNDIIRAVAAANGAQVVEAGELIGPDELEPDCLHVNDGGHGAIARAFIAALGG